MAITSIKVALVNGSDGTNYAKISKVVDTVTHELCIKSVPDLDISGAPDRLETTTMCDEFHTYMDGLKNLPEDGWEFTANYDAVLFEELQDAKYGSGGANKYWGIYIGPDGENGKFTFEGYAEVRLNGFGVGEVVEMTVIIHPTTLPEFAAE